MEICRERRIAVEVCPISCVGFLLRNVTDLVSLTASRDMQQRDLGTLLVHLTEMVSFLKIGY